MKVLVLVLLGAAVLAVNASSIHYGWYGCKVTHPDAHIIIDHYAWKMAITFCVRTAYNTIDDCAARLDDCRPALHKLEFAIQEGLWPKARQHIVDCTHLMDIKDFDEDLLPETIIDCPTLELIYQMGYTIDNMFSAYKCVATRIDEVGLQNFTTCINGHQ